MGKQDGGPAFPADTVPTGDGGRRPAMFSGMTLRDYFAAKALAGMASQYHEHWETRRLAEAAYELADAMLKARQA